MKLNLWTCFFMLAVDFDWTEAVRYKRVVAFQKGSSYFYRINYKINSVSWTTIFAHASGFKVVWPLPDGSRSRRAIENPHESIHLMYESYGLNGQTCLSSNLCEAINYAEHKGGIMSKILKLLARTSNANWTHVEDLTLECKQHMMACPMQLINVNSFFEP
ncbi:uncharacterized protein [Chelonus insularis]|uniref:uncharacterized protein n=1 Tax=Chelonus insularis TaxID=460826 RepID=UPI00158CC996|nr:uncharacterized protein LOC118064567 [Chelonus insularis]